MSMLDRQVITHLLKSGSALVGLLLVQNIFRFSGRNKMAVTFSFSYSGDALVASYQ